MLVTVCWKVLGQLLSPSQMKGQTRIYAIIFDSLIESHPSPPKSSSSDLPPTGNSHNSQVNELGKLFELY